MQHTPFIPYNSKNTHQLHSIKSQALRLKILWAHKKIQSSSKNSYHASKQFHHKIYKYPAHLSHKLRHNSEKVINNEKSCIQKSKKSLEKSSGNHLCNYWPLNIHQALYVLESLLQFYKKQAKSSNYWCLCIDKLQIRQNNEINFDISGIQYADNLSQIQLIKFLVESIKKLADLKFLDFYSYFQLSQKRVRLSIKKMVTLLKSYAQCSRIIIPKKFQLSIQESRFQKFRKQRMSHQLSQNKQQKTRYHRFSFQQNKSIRNDKEKKKWRSSIINNRQCSSQLDNHQNSISPQYTITINDASKFSCPKVNASFLSNHTKQSVSSSQCHQFTGNKVENEEINDNKIDNDKMDKDCSEWGIVSFDITSQNRFLNNKMNQTKLKKQRPISVLNDSRVEQVISIGSSLSEQSIHFNNRSRNITDEDDQLEKLIKINVNKVINNNNWAKNVENLFSAQPQLKISVSAENITQINNKNKNEQKRQNGALWFKQTLQSNLAESHQISDFY